MKLATMKCCEIQLNHETGPGSPWNGRTRQCTFVNQPLTLCSREIILGSPGAADLYHMIFLGICPS